MPLADNYIDNRKRLSSLRLIKFFWMWPVKNSSGILGCLKMAKTPFKEEYIRLAFNMSSELAIIKSKHFIESHDLREWSCDPATMPLQFSPRFVTEKYRHVQMWISIFWICFIINPLFTKDSHTSPLILNTYNENINIKNSFSKFYTTRGGSRGAGLWGL